LRKINVVDALICLINDVAALQSYVLKLGAKVLVLGVE
jgi:hypothetical protein